MKIDWRSFRFKYVKDKDAFPFSIRFYDAPQGGGKTLSMVHDVLELKKAFPDTQIFSNVKILCDDVHLFSSIDELIDVFKITGKIKHSIIVIDEALSYFAENGGIDPAIMSEITQSRKCRRFVMISTQKFSRVNNRLRDFSLETVKCNNIFGFIQYNQVRSDEKLHWDKEEMDFVGSKKYSYIFKRNKQLFNSYDTYQKININKDIRVNNLFGARPPAPQTEQTIKIKKGF